MDEREFVFDDGYEISPEVMAMTDEEIECKFIEFFGEYMTDEEDKA